MSGIFERLNALSNPKQPLTQDYFFSTAIFTLLSQEWLLCVSALMNEPYVASSKVIAALKQEGLRCKARAEDILEPASVSSAKTKPQSTSSNHNGAVKRFTFCNVDGHDLNTCFNTARILQEAKARRNQGNNSQSDSTQPTKKKNSKQPLKPAAKAGRTSVAQLGSLANNDGEETNYSGLEIGVVSHQAVCSLLTSATPHPVAIGDLNLDSGCSMTMLPTAAPLLHLRGDNTNVHLANQSTVEATKKGLLLLPLSVKTKVKALVVPSLHEPLLSVANLCNKDLRVVFTKDGCDIYSSTDLPLTSKPVGKGYRCGNLYYLPAEPVSSNFSLVSSATPAENSLLGYHICFSHIGLRPLQQLLKLGGIAPTILNEVDVQQCPVCVQSKLPRRALKSRQPYCSKEPASFEKDGKHPICALRSDNGGEYISTQFTSYLASAGICHEPGPPHSLELNGVAERTNWTISNHIRCALLQAKVPKSFWADALRHSFHSFNSFPCKTPLGFKAPSAILEAADVTSVAQTDFMSAGPTDTLEQRNNVLVGPADVTSVYKTDVTSVATTDLAAGGCNRYNPFGGADLSTLHPFGCLSWYKVPEANRKKLNPKGRAAMLLSYLSDGNGYRLWDLGKRQVVMSRDVVFQDFTFPYTTELSADPPAIQAEIVWPQLNSEAVPAPPTKVPPQRPSTPEMPLLDVQLEPRFDRRLSASIHAVPTSPAPSSISPPSPPPPSPQEPDIPEAPTKKPNGVVLITLPPLPDSPSPQPQGNPIAPSGIVSVPDSPNTGHAPSSPPRQRSGRERRGPDRYGSWAKSAKVDEDLDTPKTWRQLLNSPHKARWLKAADDKFASLLGMNTWKLVPQPHKRKLIKSKWVFKIKRCPDRSIQKLKGRLVAMGYTQVHGLDYQEVFSPTL
ncbi:hypothetical protein PCANC_02453 [Puccinia coronata f. sp. avenae]|uniref:Integrase catalytic domain-containing protein n=1 Tax=Puccinia coronata f. sp. avenae TaxID=200324 RepID=A0A2N5W515_9BASI|nr:hypothetical protein PCANC_02453 [Puccinia coronata f. sp. avenae]